MVDQPDLKRLGGIDEVASEAHLARPAHPDGLGQHDGETPPGHDADTGVGVAELRPLAGNQEVAVERQLEPPCDGHTVHCTDERLFEVGEGATHSVGVG